MAEIHFHAGYQMKRLSLKEFSSVIEKIGDDSFRFCSQPEHPENLETTLGRIYNCRLCDRCTTRVLTDAIRVARDAHSRRVYVNELSEFVECSILVLRDHNFSHALRVLPRLRERLRHSDENFIYGLVYEVLVGMPLTLAHSHTNITDPAKGKYPKGVSL